MKKKFLVSVETVVEISTAVIDDLTAKELAMRRVQIRLGLAPIGMEFKVVDAEEISNGEDK